MTMTYEVFTRIVDGQNTVMYLECCVKCSFLSYLEGKLNVFMVIGFAIMTLQTTIKANKQIK